MARRARESDQMDLLVTAAMLYYEQDRSQERIARELGVSRPAVSRLLSRARELGIVQIQIVPPGVDPRMETALRDELGLRAVHIAPGVADSADPGPVLAAPLDSALSRIDLRPGQIFVVGWGRAVHSLARAAITPRPGVRVVPGLGGSDGDRPWFQPNEIARLWAETLRGEPRYLHAPAMVSPALLRSLLAEPGIRSTVGMWRKADAALVGIGTWPKPDPSYAASGFPIEDPMISDAAGDVAGRSFTEDGELVDFSERHCLLAVTAHRLQRIPNVIGLAAGADKAKGVIGAARAGLITELVTDTMTARAVIERLDRSTRAAKHPSAGNRDQASRTG